VRHSTTAFRPHTARLALAACLALVAPRGAAAHCDTLGGPVVADAQGDIGPVLKWVRPADEADIRAAFSEAMAVRGGGPAARALADRYFFETLVRLHRAGEGAPFTGLRPEGEVEPIVLAADRALAAGSPDELVGELSARVAEGIRARFAHAQATRAHAERDVAHGRDWVAAYVELTHYLERLERDSTTAAAHAAPAAGGAPHDH
jgi:hypothetical protein